MLDDYGGDLALIRNALIQMTYSKIQSFYNPHLARITYKLCEKRKRDDSASVALTKRRA